MHLASWILKVLKSNLITLFVFILKADLPMNLLLHLEGYPYCLNTFGKINFVKDANTTPLGSGPYKIKNVVGSSIEYERVDDYWGHSHPTTSADITLNLKIHLFFRPKHCFRKLSC